MTSTLQTPPSATRARQIFPPGAPKKKKKRIEQVDDDDEVTVVVIDPTEAAHRSLESLITSTAATSKAERDHLEVDIERLDTQITAQRKILLGLESKHANKRRRLETLEHTLAALRTARSAATQPTCNICQDTPPTLFLSGCRHAYCLPCALQQVQQPRSLSLHCAVCRAHSTDLASLAEYQVDMAVPPSPRPMSPYYSPSSPAYTS